ncbi:hypothetical protein KCU91_g15305, partial [Aureobasidium melanogenum]
MSTYRRSREDSVPAAPNTNFDIRRHSSAEEDMPDDGGEWNGLQRLVCSPSAPTTPRKRKIHFIEPPPEHLTPRRSNTAPPGFRIPSTTTLDRESTKSEERDAEEVQPDLISFEDSENVPPEATKNLDEISLNSHERDPDFYDMGG